MEEIKPNPIKPAVLARNQAILSDEQKHAELASRGITNFDETKVDTKGLKQWVSKLYSKVLFDPKELRDFYEEVRYKGFDREGVLSAMMSKFENDMKLAAQLIIVVALSGPKRASITQLGNGKTPSAMGIPASGQQGNKNLSCNKILAATADLAAFYLKQLNVPKRMNLDLPAWLQFPSAGSIRLPERYRDQHREFARRFSRLIGGIFQEQIYEQMVANAYLNKSLSLFD